MVGVILNLGVWFALHAWFRELHALRSFGLALDVPVWTSVRPWAVTLSLAAMLAIFHFRIGMLTTLFGCAIVGVVLRFGRRHRLAVGPHIVARQTRVDASDPVDRVNRSPDDRH